MTDNNDLPTPMANKTPAMRSFLKDIAPHKTGCPTCGSENKEFRNELSKKEYGISGMCQECQDSVFGTD